MTKLREGMTVVKNKIDGANGKTIDRRNFFRSAGLGAVGASASVLLVPGTASSEPEIKGREKMTGKYRLTDHVKQAYRLARF